MPTPYHQVSNTLQILAPLGPIAAFAKASKDLVGLGRFELPTPRLSSVCSNQAELQARHFPGHWTTSHRFSQNQIGQLAHSQHRT